MAVFWRIWNSLSAWSIFLFAIYLNVSFGLIASTHEPPEFIWGLLSEVSGRVWAFTQRGDPPLTLTFILALTPALILALALALA